MNHSIIIYMLGWIMNIEAALMLIPILTAVVYKEGIISCYAGVAVVCAVLGFLCTRKKPKVRMFFAREGFVLVSLGWLVLSFFGCLPFVLSGEIPHFIDALFEIVSGFTTTGSSILPEVEKLSKASLIWRSFSHCLLPINLIWKCFDKYLLKIAKLLQTRLVRSYLKRQQ